MSSGGFKLYDVFQERDIGIFDRDNRTFIPQEYDNDVPSDDEQVYKAIRKLHSSLKEAIEHQLIGKPYQTK